MSNKTVFIIGAGASKEAELPTGYELKNEISKLLDIKFEPFEHYPKTGDVLIAETLRLHVKGTDGKAGDINPYLYEAWHIRDALPQAISIDNFIDTQRGNDKIELCGKLAIVRSILSAERNSLLYFEQIGPKSKMDFNKLTDTWYISFFQLLTENCTKEDLEERFKQVKLIVFNYDRCIEHFIYYALQNYYRLSNIEASELMEYLEIYHPYGVVGTLPWVKSGKVEFGVEPTPNMLLEIAGSIKTFTEGTDPSSSEITSIRKSMGSTDKLVFLGFAFHKLNLELIKPINFKRNRVIECFATTKGISQSDERVVENQIGSLYNGSVNVNLINIKCFQFFKEFWRSLGF